MHEAPNLRDDGVAIPKTASYALFGQPIERSLSPRIHSAFAEQTGVRLLYQAISADLDSFAQRLHAFEQAGGAGANVTAPLKQAAARLCRRLTPVAERAGVVNTLSRLPEGGFLGDNTDGVGLIDDLCRRHQHDIRERRTLLLGAGGAIAGVLPALLDAGVGEVQIANRNPERAEALALRIGDPERVHARYWQDLADQGVFDLVINGTSAGVHGQPLDLPMGLLAPRAVVYDLNYGHAASAFLAWGRAAGAEAALDGLGMLVDQAAASFQRWHDRKPDADAVFQQLRREVLLHGED